ncbi:MAG: DUF1795 domain-containing protein [Oscillospiraceae bacterium]|nr:DUF1795 domain-containing protein [Oscillospiraceae bacterium]
MKRFKIFSIVLAAMTAMMFSSCDKKNDSSNQSSQSNSAAESTESVTEESTEPATEAETEPAILGIKAENPVYGYSVIIPESLNKKDGSVISDTVAAYEDEYAMFEGESGDNLNIVIDDAMTDEEWRSRTKEKFQKEYQDLYEYMGMSTTIEITAFEAVKIDGFDAYRLEIDGKNENGSQFSQIQIIVNRNNDTSAPYCYTFTYTDYSGSLEELCDNSINSIKFTDTKAPSAPVDENAGKPFAFNSGFEFSAPEGWSYVTDDNSISHEITGNQAEFSADGGGSIIITVSDEADDENNFKAYTQQDVELLFAKSFESFDDFNVLSFDSFNVDKYNAHKIKYRISMGELEIHQTILMINCPDKNKGVCLILSDYGAGYDDISNNLEKTIKFK